MGLSACANAGTEPSAIVGETLAEADGVLPVDAVFIVQDVSPLFNEQPTYDEGQFGSAQWTVVAACANAGTLESSSTIEIAIAPTTVITKEQIGAARGGEFSDAVVCNF